MGKLKSKIKEFIIFSKLEKLKYFFRLGLITLFVLYTAYILMYVLYDKNQEEEILLNHSRVVEKALYMFDDEVPVNYLIIACDFYNYKEITILDNYGNKFLEVEGTKLNMMDRFFSYIGFIYEKEINTDIRYEGELIGKLVIIRQMKHVYDHFKTFAISILMFITYLFVVWIVLTKRELEIRVKDRTFKLEVEINEHKKAKTELVKAKEKAEESDKLKSAFLANMSHEIRTPMNGILGFADLLKKPNLSGDKQKNYISLIEKSGRRMLNIINDIIDISKIEAGLMQVDITKVNINSLTEYMYNFFKPETNAKGIELTLKNTSPKEEVFIYTDKEKLIAILTNLIKNAIKFITKGFIEFGYEKRGNYLEFFVKDSGIGIPSDRLEAIFERFIQSDVKDKQAFQGAGLGLSITKSYVEMLGGTIGVESKEGNGSIFYFNLPYTNKLPVD